MKLLEIQMQRGRNVKKVILFIVLISSMNFGHSQEKIKGVYMTSNGIAEYNFSTKSIFEMKIFEGIHGALNGYAKGHYFIKNDSLIFNYDLTKLKEESYFKSRKYFNYKDSITISLNVYDFNNKPLNNIGVFAYPNSVLTLTNVKGNAILKLKKEKQEKEITLNLNGDSFAQLTIPVNYKVNYIIDAYLSKSKSAGFGHLKAYKNNVDRYKILATSKDSIKLYNGKYIIYLIRTEK